MLATGGLLHAAIQDEAVIRTTTNLVEVRVVAEAHNKPVADLRKSDFEIFDDKKPQPIRLFAAYRGTGSAKDPITGDESEAGSPTPSEYAVILLDWMNASYGHRVYVKDEVLRLLKNYQPRQRVAIFVLSRKNPRLLADFTYDRGALIDLVDRLSLDWEDLQGPSRDEPIGGRTARGSRGEATSPAYELRLSYGRNQLVDTTATLEKIAEHLRQVPGRKTLLWVSSGIPMTIEGSYYGPFIEPALGKLNSADTAIYAIDAAGFDPNPSDSLFEFARRTGGLTYHLSNDLAEGMRSALEDTAVSYTLGFHMPEDAKAGLHAITVLVHRPGIKLRYRESYDPTASVR